MRTSESAKPENSRILYRDFNESEYIKRPTLEVGPDVLRRIVDEAVGPFFDATLGSRVNAAKYEWDAEAQRRLDAALDNDHVAEIQARAIEHIEALQAELDALEAAVEEANIDLPPFTAPEPILNGEPDLPLVSSDMPLLDHIVILKHRKGIKMKALR